MEKGANLSPVYSFYNSTTVLLLGLLTKGMIVSKQNLFKGLFLRKREGLTGIFYGV